MSEEEQCATDTLDLDVCECGDYRSEHANRNGACCAVLLTYIYYFPHFSEYICPCRQFVLKRKHVTAINQ